MFSQSHLPFVALTLFVGVTIHGQEANFTLELKKLLPCQQTSDDVNVSIHRSDVLAVQTDLRFCSNFSWSIDQYNVSYIN